MDNDKFMSPSSFTKDQILGSQSPKQITKSSPRKGTFAFKPETIKKAQDKIRNKSSSNESAKDTKSLGSLVSGGSKKTLQSILNKNSDLSSDQ